MMIASLDMIDTWIFDLDNTLYPHEAEVMALVSEKMTVFVARELNVSPQEALIVQKKYLSEHGTTLAGLMANHGIDPYHFLNEVHDVSLDQLSVDDELNGQIGALLGKKYVFTNGDRAHAERLIDHLGMTSLFDGLFYLEHADFIPKPNPHAYKALCARFDLNAKKAIFFEDSVKNLKPAKDLGMKTAWISPHFANNDAAQHKNAYDFIDFHAPSLKAFFTQSMA